jgi:hypothetical protein
LIEAKLGLPARKWLKGLEASRGGKSAQFMI